MPVRKTLKHQINSIYFCRPHDRVLKIDNSPLILQISMGQMATHSSILAWRIPWTEEPGGLQSTGSQRVKYNWATSLPFFSILHVGILSHFCGQPKIVKIDCISTKRCSCSNHLCLQLTFWVESFLKVILKNFIVPLLIFAIQLSSPKFGSLKQHLFYFMILCVIDWDWAHSDSSIAGLGIAQASECKWQVSCLLDLVGGAAWLG